jgi:hypothetical protein
MHKLIMMKKENSESRISFCQKGYERFEMARDSFMKEYISKEESAGNEQHEKGHYHRSKCALSNCLCLCNFHLPFTLLLFTFMPSSSPDSLLFFWSRQLLLSRLPESSLLPPNSSSEKTSSANQNKQTRAGRKACKHRTSIVCMLPAARALDSFSKHKNRKPSKSVLQTERKLPRHKVQRPRD